MAEIEIHRHAYQSGVFAKRAAGKDLRAAASPALTQGRFADLSSSQAPSAMSRQCRCSTSFLRLVFGPHRADDEIGMCTVEVSAGP